MKALFWRKAGMQYRRAYSYEFSLWLSKTCQANNIISIKGESVCTVFTRSETLGSHRIQQFPK